MPWYYYDFHDVFGLVVVRPPDDVNCFCMRDILKTFTVNRQNLVTTLKVSNLKKTQSEKKNFFRYPQVYWQEICL